ncbi:MAG: hypothetical protein IT545_01570 [Rhodobacteraceae bacterium]|nr:hypothetical protein [Paracoccaceae bacterium]
MERGRSVRGILPPSALAVLAVLAAAPGASGQGLGASDAAPEAPPGVFFAAEVTADGRLRSGIGVTGLEPVTDVAGCEAGGCTEVRLRRRNLATACWWTATIGGRAPGATVAGAVDVVPREEAAGRLLVVTRDATGLATDLPFILTVLCR